MNDPASDSVFAGSVPETYERLLVPLIFDPYALDLAQRAAMLTPQAVLEVAAGTGVVTRAIVDHLGAEVDITATDLNPDMLAHAQSVGTARPVNWQQANVMTLPFPDDSFDVVVCQFSVMFFPDRGGAFAEVRRVLRPGGTFLFNVWDNIANNEFAATVTDAVGEMFPTDPPLFLARTPHGHHDNARIRDDLAAGGFAGHTKIEALEHRSRAATSDLPAIAYCQGTPLRDEIVARDPQAVPAAIERATLRLTERFGATDLDSKIRGFVVTASND